MKKDRKAGRDGKNTKRSKTKNILINFRSYFVKYIKSHLPKNHHDKFLQNFEKKPSVHRGDYTELFSKKEYKKIIEQTEE